MPFVEYYIKIKQRQQRLLTFVSILLYIFGLTERRQESCQIFKVNAE